MDILLTGIGMLQTTYSVTKYLELIQPSIIIQAGIGGSFRKDWPLGTVVQVTQEVIAELGFRESDKRFVSMFDSELMDKNQAPFSDGILRNEKEESFKFLTKARGVSCNTVTGTEERKQELFDLYDPEIESMEGAGFFYPCLQSNIPFIEVRSISNYVGDRNREEWEVPLAIKNLNEVLLKMIQVCNSSIGRSF